MGSFTPAPNALAPGDRLDRYELLCILAQGGMGTVWLSRLTGKHGFERLVALKTILPTYGGDRTFVDMFLDEARIAAQIDHENVVRTLEIGEDKNVLYHAMELVDGESVRKLYRDVRAAAAAFPLGVALRIAADVCAGLHAVHELKDAHGTYLEVVHRDVSPQNILLTVRGTVKLIDFGVAKAKERRTEETTAGTLKGKIEYMAPEQANGTRVDRRADVYAVGAVLYELLAGEPVRNTEDGRQLLALHELMTGAPYEPLHAGVPLPVRTVVDRALANDPEDRFRTAEDMRRAIESAMTSIGLIATSDDVANALNQYSRERTTRRKDAIDAAVRVAQALEKERGGDPRTGPGAPSQRSLPAAASSRGSLKSITAETGIKGTLVQPLAPPLPASAHAHISQPTGPVPPSSRPHPLQGQIVMGPNGPELFNGMPAPISSGQLPGMPGEGPVTGPSMRTMQGASISAPPPAPSSGSRIGTIAVLAIVGVLGVVAGVLVARQPGRSASDTPAAPVTYVPATPLPTSASTSTDTTQLTAQPQPTLLPPPAVLPTSTTSTGKAGTGTTAPTTDKVTEKTTEKTEKPKPKPKPKKKGDGDEYGF